MTFSNIAKEKAIAISIKAITIWERIGDLLIATYSTKLGIQGAMDKDKILSWVLGALISF